ncbi:MAG: hypothetical protein JRH20_15810 [Deltaproteobacteria bacterium]|nr:hypothetical protein [Deltaproteobacteria bacterium]
MDDIIQSTHDAGFGCDPAEHCGATGFLCGTHNVAGCGAVDCGACQFVRLKVGSGDVKAASDGTIHLAYEKDGSIWYSQSSTTALEPELISDVEASAPSLAMGEDGSIHVAWGQDTLWYATRAAHQTQWQIVEVGPLGDLPAQELALDAKGQIHIVFLGEEPAHMSRLIHATFTDGQLTTRIIGDDVMPSFPLTLARGAAGQISVAVRDHPGLLVAHLVDGVFVLDKNVPALRDVPRSDLVGELASTYLSDGTYHLIALTGDYTFRSGTHGHYLRLANGVWRLDEYPGGSELELATGPDDGIHRVSMGPVYSRLFETPGVHLSPDDSCDDGRSRLAIDDKDQPHILFRNDCGSFYMTPVGRYPEGFFQSCESLAVTVCAHACGCGGESCCYGSADSTHSSCGSSQSVCEWSFHERFCQDQTMPIQPLFDCIEQVNAGSTCIDIDNEPHWALPDVCFGWQS